MSWGEWSCKKRGTIIGFVVFLIIFSILHSPIAILFDNFFTSKPINTIIEQDHIDEVHLIALIFFTGLAYCMIMGFIIGQLMDKLKKCSQS